MSATHRKLTADKQLQFIELQLSHRIKAVAFLLRLLSGTRSWTSPKPMVVLIDGKPVFQGPHYVLTNPSIEIGLVYCRSLLEFMGIKSTGDKLQLVPAPRPRPDDISIEDFDLSGTALARVSIDQALATYPGPRAEATAGYLTLLAHADKAVAHLTIGPRQDEATLDQLEYGSTGVLRLMEAHFYQALNLPKPDYGIRSEKRLE